MYIDMHCSLLQFISCERELSEKGEKKEWFDIIYDSTRAQKLMRGMGFLENYCGLKKGKNVEARENVLMKI
jgi:hypothetical protein